MQEISDVIRLTVQKAIRKEGLEVPKIKES